MSSVFSYLRHACPHCLPASETPPPGDGHNAAPRAASAAQFRSGAQGSGGSQKVQT